MIDSIESVSFDLIDRIRHHINKAKKQATLLHILSIWLQLTAALDTLEDSSCAVQYYCETDYPDTIKGKYLFTYGLLQAIFLQQDAISGINKALFGTTIDFKDYPAAFSARNLRNDVVGHPVSMRVGGSQFVYLAQISMTKYSFYYLKETADSATETIEVDVAAVINDTQRAINFILSKALDTLDMEFQAYVNEHKERKMKEIFTHLGYAREKVLLDEHMAAWGYSATKDMVKKCENELVLRYGGIDVVDSYGFLLKSIHLIYDLIDNGIPRVPVDLQPDMHHALLENLFSKLEELEEYCEETDEEFENGGKI